MVLVLRGAGVILWLAAVLPVVSAERVCYNSFGSIICHNRLPFDARAAIWCTCVGILLIILVTAFMVHRQRASRARDAIASVEASQVHGPPLTPFGSSFVQVQRPPVTYPAYGPRTAAVPPSAYSVAFTANLPQRGRTPYSSSSHYPQTAELLGLPESPRPGSKREAVTPRDKNTRFIIPETGWRREREEREQWRERALALRSAPVEGKFEESGGEGVTQVKSASVVGRLKPLLAGRRVREA